jgi:superfamily II DNA/RNA helicase
MESFSELSLPAFLGQTLKQMNFTQPTPVQAQAIPPALEGKDVIASAQTGTGKTAAFGIPLMVFLENHKDKTALILTPTRELAQQVLGVLRQLNGQHPLGGSVLLIGGAPMGPQLTALSRKPRLFIGTPGRVIDHLTRKSLKLDRTGFLVLDEADRMLDMGFAPQLDEIRNRLTSPRQTLLFSATIPPDIQKMAAQYLKDPVRISVGDQSQPVEKIDQQIIYTTEHHKAEELEGELNSRQGSVLVFARTQHRVDHIADRLKDKGFKATRIHGGRTQAQRKQAIDHFREGHYRILVATDIAARGLDIHHIAHVINYDLPRNPEDYIHRVGRTARAGAEGNSLCFLTAENRELWQRILRLMGSSQATITNKPSRFGDMTPKPVSPHRGQGPGGAPRSFASKPGGRPNFPGNKFRPGGGFQKNRKPRSQGYPPGGFQSEEFQTKESGSGSHRAEGYRPAGHRPEGQSFTRPWLKDRKPKGPWPRSNRPNDRRPPMGQTSGSSARGPWQKIRSAEGRGPENRPFQPSESTQRFEGKPEHPHDRPRVEGDFRKKHRHPEGRHQKRSEEHQRRTQAVPGPTSAPSHENAGQAPHRPASTEGSGQPEKNWNKPGAAEGHASLGFRERPGKKFGGVRWGDKKPNSFPKRHEGGNPSGFQKDDRYQARGVKPSFNSHRPSRPFGKPGQPNGGFHPEGGHFKPKRNKER